MMITDRINFKEIGLSDRPGIESITRKYPPYSDFNFISLYSWGAEEPSYFSIIDGCLVIKLSAYMENGYIYSVLGGSSVKKVVSGLFEYQHINELELIPEGVLAELGHPPAEHQRDEDDYIYDIRTVLQMDGPEYRHLRRSLSNFKTKQDLASFSTKQIDNHDRAEKDEVIRVAHGWASDIKRQVSDTAKELAAITRAINTSAELNVNILGVYKANQLVGFTITEVIDDWAILHFEKAEQLPGLGSHLKIETFKFLANRGCTKLNYEQDLGIRGLREAKMSLVPERFLKKYKLLA